ncbi:MAG: diguanylate cyclase [Planctomycetota bacterium]
MTQAPAETEIDAAAPTPPRCDTVLLIEDDKLVARFVERLLSRQGYTMTWAPDGQAGLDAMRNQRFPLVMTDCEMPGLNGMEVSQKIRADESLGFTYLIMLTGRTDSKVITEAFEAGVDDFINKPCSPPELYARLQAAQRIIALEDNLARQNLRAHRMNAELAVLNDQLDHIANYDALTEVFNRKAGIERLDQAMASAERRGRELSVLMIDIDKFKTLNDEHGHEAGDLGVTWVAQTVQQLVPSHGAACRLGGDEFLAILPDTSSRDALLLGEKLRTHIAQGKGRPDGVPADLLTLSIGLATCEPDSGLDRTTLLRLADEAMYKSKRSGRDRVSLHQAA